MRLIAVLLLCSAPVMAQDIDWKPLSTDLNSGPVYVGPREAEAAPNLPDDQGFQRLDHVLQAQPQQTEPAQTATPQADDPPKPLPQRPKRLAKTPIPTQAVDPRTLKPEPLSEEELGYARTAWSYFAQNLHPETGLVPSVRNFKSMTLWDEGGYFLALISAHRLGLVSRAETSDRLLKAFSALSKLPLLNIRLPNKAYNIEQLIMTDYANKPQPQGIGCSALDIMRLMSGLLVATQEFPELTPLVQLIVQRWDLAKLAKDQRFSCVALLHKKHKATVQEGRIGYEQYAGVTGKLLGLPVDLAYQYKPILRWQQYFDIRLPADKRTAKTHGVSAVTTSEPFLLEVLEYGWRPEAFEVAMAVFAAQLHRYRRTDQLTSLSEDHIKGAPYFAYNGIIVDWEPFISVTAGRKNVSNKRGISAKASFGWWAITRHPYTFKLLDAVSQLQTEEGWMAGLFESDMSKNEILTLNTNAMILEALHYKAFGPLYRF